MITATGITKNYQRGAESFAALKGVSLNINEGDFICLLGPSGAGKTTLLNILGCMDAPADGDLVIAGQKVVTSGRRQLTDAKLDRFRRKHIGFIFTDFFLIPSLTALENVEMPLLWSGKPNRERAKELLASVNMDHRLNHRPTELSGGEVFISLKQKDGQWAASFKDQITGFSGPLSQPVRVTSNQVEFPVPLQLLGYPSAFRWQVKVFEGDQSFQFPVSTRVVVRTDSDCPNMSCH